MFLAFSSDSKFYLLAFYSWENQVQISHNPDQIL